VNFTLSGAGPVVGVPLNCAPGTAAVDGLTHTKIKTKIASNNTLVDFIPFTSTQLSMITLYKIT
jgi:hypothetical protein